MNYKNTPYLMNTELRYQTNCIQIIIVFKPKLEF